MNARKWVVPLLLAGWFVVPSAHARNIEQELDIYYVPSPELVVEEMLGLAEVAEGDTVYDLGSGDGRIVITAASRFGTKGVGIDLDPERIAESVANAKAAGVEDKVRFIEGNLFDADLTEASVVTLYLLTSVNERLRPKLLSELRPGTRVVSHAFGMGTWQPDKESYADGAKVFLWVVPASVQGRWQGSIHGENGDTPFNLLLEQAFQEVTGMVVLGGGHVGVDEARLAGDRFEFSITSGAGEALRLTGRVTGDVIEGSVFNGDANVPASRWSAARVPSAAGEVLTGAERDTGLKGAAAR